MKFGRKDHRISDSVPFIIFIITAISCQYIQQANPQSAGIQLFIPSQYDRSQNSMLPGNSMPPGYPMISYPYTGSAPQSGWNYSPMMSQVSPGSIGSYPSIQSQMSPAPMQFQPFQMQSSFLSPGTPQGYSYSPIFSQSTQYANMPQEYPYPTTMSGGGGSFLNSQNVPQDIQILPGASQMMPGFGAAESPNPSRTVRILVPVYAPSPESPPPPHSHSHSHSKHSSSASKKSGKNNQSSSSPLHTKPTDPSLALPQSQPTDPSTNFSLSQPIDPSSAPPQSQPTDPSANLSLSLPIDPSLAPPLSQPTDPTLSSVNSHSIDPPPGSSDPYPNAHAHATAPATHDPTLSPPTSSNASPTGPAVSNADASLSKIHELIQTAAAENDPDDTKLISNILGIVQNGLDVEKSRTKQAGGIMASQHGSSSSDSTSIITNSINALINKIVNDALTDQ